MSRLRVAPIVEGHGEYAAIRILLTRIWSELLGGEFIDVLRPIREKRHRLGPNKDDALSKAVNLAAGKLKQSQPVDDPSLILILVDADKDAPCLLAPQMLAIARAARTDQDIACVVANVEYETWFVAAAESLSDYLLLEQGEIAPQYPEEQRCGEGWIGKRFKAFQYSKSVDQPKLTAQMDLHQCRSHSPSFDKLCRDLEARMTRSASP